MFREPLDQRTLVTSISSLNASVRGILKTVSKTSLSKQRQSWKANGFAVYLALSANLVMAETVAETVAETKAEPVQAVSLDKPSTDLPQIVAADVAEQVVGSAAESGDDQREAWVWLEKMGQALRLASYEGTFTYMRG